jgi:hypothetical protein
MMVLIMTAILPPSITKVARNIVKSINLFLHQEDQYMVLGTLVYIIIIIVAIIIIIALLKFLFQLFFIAPVGIDALDLEVYSRAIFALQPSQ